MKKMLFVIVFLLAIGLGLVVYFTARKPPEKKEGEITIGDLMEQSRQNISGTNKKGAPKNFSSPIAPASYEGTLLAAVPENDQKAIREGGSELPFATYVPMKLPRGFSLRPTSVSNGVQNNIQLFHFVFSHANGDSIVIDQYSLPEYLTATGQTMDEFTDGREPVNIGGKKIYLSDIGTRTEGRFQYYQAVTVIIEPAMIRVQYAGEKKISESDLTELAASFVR